MFQVQHLAHDVGPSVLCIVGCSTTIGYRVSYDGNGAQVVFHCVHINACDGVPMVHALCFFEVGVSIGYSFHDIGGGA